MAAALSEVIGAVLQVLVALVFAGVFWGGHRAIAALRKKPHQGFRVWVGLVGSVASWKHRGMVILGLLAFSLGMLGVEYGLGLHEILGEAMQTVPVAELAAIEPAPAALLAGLAYAGIKTAGSEELLVRGVLYRRLIGWFGYRPANLIQATLFTLLHNGIIHLVVPDAPLLVHVDIFVRLFVPSWVVGWFMERHDGGSLFIPWVCHMMANFITFLVFFL